MNKSALVTHRSAHDSWYQCGYDIFSLGCWLNYLISTGRLRKWLISVGTFIQECFLCFSNLETNSTYDFVKMITPQGNTSYRLCFFLMCYFFPSETSANSIFYHSFASSERQIFLDKSSSVDVAYKTGIENRAPSWCHPTFHIHSQHFGASSAIFIGIAAVVVSPVSPGLFLLSFNLFSSQ